MIPESGLFLLILATVINFFLVISIFRKNLIEKSVLPKAQFFETVIISGCFLILVFLFILNDTSVNYVYQNTNSKTPLIYKITGVWSSHEGSILLWNLILSIWSCAWGISYSKQVDLNFYSIVIQFLSIPRFFFLLYTLFFSNPFERILPNVPIDGLDINPLLQDPGLIIHPPLLYCGYVGSIVTFAVSSAMLIYKRAPFQFIQLIKPFVYLSFGFLTLGISLGSFWAYYELGWGGYWFWDPVENVSFIPWLINTALIHALILAQKNKLPLTTIFNLSFYGFITSVLGTFLVRSGILSSVHSFAHDPSRGVVLLAIFFILTAFYVIIYLNNKNFFQTSIEYKLYSRETILLLNIYSFIGASALILIGTLYPLVIEAINGSQLSVGAPYFNKTFFPLMLPSAASLFVLQSFKWGSSSFRIKKSSLIAYAATVLWIGFQFPEFQDSLISFAYLSIACIIVLSTMYSFLKNYGFFLSKIRMHLSHFGIALTTLGILFSSVWSVEQDIRWKVGEKQSINNYLIKFEKIEEVIENNYISKKATFTINNEKILYPEKRLFIMREISMTETAIDAGCFRDIYISLGDEISNDVWSVRLYYKPFIRFIWLGGLCIALATMSSKISITRRKSLVQVAS